MNAIPKMNKALEEVLVSYFSDPQRPEGTMSYFEVCGFLFAVACSPEMIAPSEWLEIVLDDQKHAFENEEEARSVLAALMSLYNDVNAGVFDGYPSLPRSCTILEDPMANLAPASPLSQWSRGFARGHGWLEEVWDGLVPEELDHEIGAQLMTLSFFASEGVARSFLAESTKGDLAIEDLARTMHDLFPAAMEEYARFSRVVADVVEGRDAPVKEPIRSEKIGRNAPCPCGSGKKYKKCCGMKVETS